MMSNTVRARVGGHVESPRVGAGIRAAMYGEMAAAAAGDRPWWSGEGAWDAALVGAIHFLEASGFDEPTSRSLLDEAAELRVESELSEWTAPAAELCRRLASEFRRQAAH